MHWIYILKCYDCDDCDGIGESIYYVGQTKRLYSRFWEHASGCGGTNTSVFTPQELVAIYKVSEISKFINYNEKIININNDKNLEWTYHTGFNNPHYVLNNWDDFNKKGYIVCPISNFVYTKEGLGEMNPQKLFNYVLQNMETSQNVLVLWDMFRILRGYKTKLVLYTYDSFLFDWDESETKLLDEIRNIFTKYKLNIKEIEGYDYNFGETA